MPISLFSLILLALFADNAKAQFNDGFNDGNNNSRRIIAGVVVAVIFVLACIFLALGLQRRRRRAMFAIQQPPIGAYNANNYVPPPQTFGSYQGYPPQQNKPADPAPPYTPGSSWAPPPGPPPAAYHQNGQPGFQRENPSGYFPGQYQSPPGPLPTQAKYSPPSSPPPNAQYSPPAGSPPTHASSSDPTNAHGGFVGGFVPERHG